MKIKVPIRYISIVLSSLLTLGCNIKNKDIKNKNLEENSINFNIEENKEIESCDKEIIYEVEDKEVNEETKEVVENNYEDGIPIIDENNSVFDYLDETTIVTATSVVNVREKKSTKSNKLNKLSVGESLPYIDETDEWCEVNYYGKSAYVYKKYIKKETNYYNKYDMSDMVYVVNKTSLIDINNNDSIINIPVKEVCEVYGQTNDYYLVKCKGKIGYVLKNDVFSLGNNYVIIDISSQNLKVYVNDKLIIDTLIVTGKDISPTYCGLFEVYKKERNVKWDEFNVTVKYWMPFNRGEGMHDASWRREFGGEIYHEDGSHGCVNIPKNIMPKIYENIEIGDKVLVKK